MSYGRAFIDSMDRFIDRHHAGTRLAAALATTLAESADAWPRPVVLGIPRGGVIVADVVARALDVELDVLGVEKIGAPWNRELAIGAVGEGDSLWTEPQLAPHVDAAVLRRFVEHERAELEAKLADVRRIRPRVELSGRTAIVVDDGIATGATVRAALLALERTRPALRVLAVPVGAPETLASLAAVADEVVCPLRPAQFRAVGLWYDAFEQTTQQQVLEVFERRAAAPSGALPA